VRFFDTRGWRAGWRSGFAGSTRSSTWTGNRVIAPHRQIFPAPGFYAVEGWVFPIQVMVLDELADPRENYMFTEGPRRICAAVK